MATLAEATQAPTTIKIGDKAYRLSPLTLFDYGVVDKWLTMLPFERAAGKMAAMGDALTQTMQDLFLAQAEEESKAAGIGHESAASGLSTVEGTAMILWLSIKKEYPEITRQAAAELISADTLEDWQKALDDVSGMSSSSDDDDSDRPTEEATQ